MSKNDLIILESILEQMKIPGLTYEENFELFSFEQVLKSYDLSYDEIFNGKVGDKYEIGFFNFVNDELLEEYDDLSDVKKASMTSYLILAKPDYAEEYLNYVSKIIKYIFDFGSNTSDIKVFRDAYLKLVPSELIVNIVLVSKDAVQSDLILQKLEDFKKVITEYMPMAKVDFRTVGPGELIGLAHKEKSYTLQLKYDKLMADEDSYFLLTSLTDYEKFITDKDGNLRRYIFDANIRDFQRTSEVNKGMAETLDSKDRADFWWYNNGVSILAKNPRIAGNIMTIDDVQIVNGLQSTYVIHKYLKNAGGKDQRKIGIKILTTEDNEIRDNIIKFANSQNPIPKTALRANDIIQRNIESYLLSNGWFYDRRKNYYKNMRKPADKIISIGFLSQAIMAMVYHEPHRSRKSPLSLTKNDKDYNHMFGLSNYKIFLFCISNMKKIEWYVHDSGLGEQYKTNLKWHLATLIIVKLLGKRYYTIGDLEKILDVSIEDDFIADTMSELIYLTDEYMSERDVIFRTVSTAREFVNYILDNVELGTDMGIAKGITVGKDSDTPEGKDINKNAVANKGRSTGIWSSKTLRIMSRQKNLLE